MFYYTEVNTGHWGKFEGTVKTNSLTVAKRVASRKQAFHLTNVVIGRNVDEDGYVIDIVAVKRNDDWWEY